MKYGGGKPGNSSNNNGGAGNTQAKSGKMRAAIDRSAGMAQAVGAIGNKTRTQAPSSSKHRHWEGCSGYGDNENILGY